MRHNKRTFLVRNETEKQKVKVSNSNFSIYMMIMIIIIGKKVGGMMMEKDK